MSKIFEIMRADVDSLMERPSSPGRRTQSSFDRHSPHCGTPRHGISSTSRMLSQPTTFSKPHWQQLNSWEMPSRELLISRERRLLVMSTFSCSLGIGGWKLQWRPLPPSLFDNEFTRRSKDYVGLIQAIRATLPRGKGKRPFSWNSTLGGGGGNTRQGTKAPRTCSRAFKSGAWYQGSKNSYPQRSCAKKLTLTCSHRLPFQKPAASTRVSVWSGWGTGAFK